MTAPPLRMLGKIAMALGTVMVTVLFAVLTTYLVSHQHDDTVTLACVWGLIAGFGLFAAGICVVIWVPPPPPPPVPAAHLVARR